MALCIKEWAQYWSHQSHTHAQSTYLPQARRETSAKVLTSLIQRDGEARVALIKSGALKSVLSLLNPTGEH